jgi:hypothetical protein
VHSVAGLLRMGLLAQTTIPLAVSHRIRRRFNRRRIGLNPLAISRLWERGRLSADVRHRAAIDGTHEQNDAIKEK